MSCCGQKRVSEDTIVARAASRGVGVYGISYCFLTRPSRPGIILGYSRMNEKEIRDGIRLLSEVFRGSWRLNIIRNDRDRMTGKPKLSRYFQFAEKRKLSCFALILRRMAGSLSMH